MVILAGVLGRDAETKFTPSGQAVTNFSVATSYSYKQKNSDEWLENTEWTNVVLWGQEKLASYLTKGSKVSLTGRLSTRSYEDKDGHKKYVTEVIADNVVLQGTKQVREEGGGRGNQSADYDDDQAPF
jgi:single-strand DNA-binding protein